jgi:DMSO reductase anchor subunit
MHPAFSVILFTTLTGTGCGLLLWLGLFAMSGFVPGEAASAMPPFVVGLALVGIGLLSSFAHLGKPLRAWRAFSQWRTSWLSREGLAAVLLIPATLWLAALAYADVDPTVPPRLVGALVLLLSLATTVCTAMIYASLPPIPAWRDRLVLPGYLLYSFAGGMLWLIAIGNLQGFAMRLPIFGVAVLAAVAAAKIVYWRRIDRVAMPAAANAIGLPDIGHVRSFERPHTETNYLLREMGYVVARRHAARLRTIAIVVGLVVPALLGVAASFATWGATWLAILAASLFQLGALVERWLFFAQARHTITSYYGVDNKA